MKKSDHDREEAIAILRKLKVRPGTLVYTTVNHVSRSGMSRRISCFLPTGKEIRNITRFVATVIGCRVHHDGGMVVGGCGMDMGFRVVYELASVMFHDGFDCVGERCPANDHRNGDRNYDKHHHRNGGYALRQQWL
jgi:hypothetical protein